MVILSTLSTFGAITSTWMFQIHFLVRLTRWIIFHEVFLEITTLKVSCFKQILDNIRKVTEIIRTTEMKPIVPILPFFSFFLSGFSFEDNDDSRYSRGEGSVDLYSCLTFTLPREHLFAILHVRWLLRKFILISRRNRT